MRMVDDYDDDIFHVICDTKCYYNLLHIARISDDVVWRSCKNCSFNVFSLFTPLKLFALMWTNISSPIELKKCDYWFHISPLAHPHTHDTTDMTISFQDSPMKLCHWDKTMLVHTSRKLKICRQEISVVLIFKWKRYFSLIVLMMMVAPRGFLLAYHVVIVVIQGVNWILL